MEDKQFKILSAKLDTLIRITAINALADKNLTEQVKILSDIGLQPRSIANILGTDNATVSTLKNRLKKKYKTNSKKDAD
ncbi:MAG: hypothetical protein NUK63_06290 [Candidatus Bathyarchaeum tardum]|nr:MAG: hypothetical protein NUK63_06290 [Candidatus Bathyarchaeum tardum]